MTKPEPSTPSRPGKLIICRHGETTYNKAKRLTGQADAPLTENGKDQAKKAGEKLSDTHIDRVYASTLSRAIDTAALALDAANNNHHLKDDKGEWKIEQRAEIIERDVGAFTGADKHSEDVKNWPKGFTDKMPDGESTSDVVDRITEFFEDELKPLLDAGETVLVVCHAGVVRAFEIMLGEYAPHEAFKAPIPNAEPTVYEFEDGTKSKVYKPRAANDNQKDGFNAASAKPKPPKPDAPAPKHKKPGGPGLG